MMRSMFAAISGLKAHQVMLDVTAADIANVNTLGYKASRMTFRDSLAQMQRGGGGATTGTGGTNAAQVGLGAQIGSIDTQMGGGALQTTGNPLDVAVSGEGWFRVGPSTGGTPAAPALPSAIQYTRAGNFTTNDQGFLVTTDGLYIMGKNPTATGPGPTDQLLQIPTGSTNIQIGQDGGVSYQGAAGRVTAGYISLAKFANQNALERQGSNTWTAGPNAGAPQVGTPGAGGVYGVTASGSIEMSNVDLASEFTNMITAQRGFQANSRVISTADQMLQDLVSLVH
ncbi:MAG: flagellar hook protein FlgE [Thermoleophilaceae bacterium]|jgi:flagellar hook protein FlgE|nr:flagellar hook protein FlgE [Thermoleophilaceae bacterium]